ncbi:unnamed protein product [Spirodela intermedia]|uniref:Uncharacterized protein n=1 Tax=Spirodela intermedia TaxID=51605 RepID=A0A7I8JRM6_SPIIN|nr:unnamed protein product [Spirodela intermedia]CAA6672779.1 unnamed protein product [Spirodela intermedia]
MRRRCTGILSIQEDRRAVSIASKALLRQRRCGNTTFPIKSLSRVCTTTPCPTASWPPMT